jgi:hypothetical protein
MSSTFFIFKRCKLYPNEYANVKPYVRYLTISCVVLSMLIFISGCLNETPKRNLTGTETENFTDIHWENRSLVLPEIFTAPIGGFEETQPGFATQALADPNSTFETNYIFFSKNETGEITYNLSFIYQGRQYLNNDHTHLKIIPSEFHVEPNHVYVSRVYLNTQFLPKDFYNYQSRGEIIPAHLSVDVNLNNNSVKYGRDDLILYPAWMPGPRFLDTISTENCSVTIKRGETRFFNTTYSRNVISGIGNISYTVTNTPLNISFVPPNFIVKQNTDFPITFSITANDPSLVPGKYPVEIEVKGGSQSLYFTCGKDLYDQFEGKFLVNVTIV